MQHMIQLWYIIVYYGSLLLFITITILFNGFAFLLHLLFRDAKWISNFIKYLFHYILSMYFRIIKSSNIIKIEFISEKLIQKNTPLIIISNHPSMIDVFLLLEKIPNASCFFKANMHSLILTERLANILGFVNNSSGIDGVRLAINEIEKGRSLIIFPEGTRTDHVTRRSPLKSAYAFASIKCNTPLAVLKILTNSNALCKGHNFRVPPTLPIRVKIEVIEIVFPERFSSIRELHSYATKLLSV